MFQKVFTGNKMFNRDTIIRLVKTVIYFSFKGIKIWNDRLITPSRIPSQSLERVAIPFTRDERTVPDYPRFYDV